MLLILLENNISTNSNQNLYWNVTETNLLLAILVTSTCFYTGREIREVSRTTIKKGKRKGKKIFGFKTTLI